MIIKILERSGLPRVTWYRSSSKKIQYEREELTTRIIQNTPKNNGLYKLNNMLFLCLFLCLSARVHVELYWSAERYNQNNVILKAQQHHKTALV